MIAPNPQTRLAVSRSRLRLELQAWQRGQEPATNGTQPSWLDALRDEPGTSVLLNALHLWWARQSWHQTTSTLAASLSQLLRPLAKRNPLMLVLGAAALGSALVLIKPWRWLSFSTIAAGLLPQLLPKLLALLSSLSWVDMLNSWLQAGNKKEL
jgi:hypothetical protein